MIYIPHIKKRLDELAPRWHQGKLNSIELDEFYDLLDEVVIEAREGRSDWVDEPQQPEVYLIDLLQQRIQRTVRIFFRKYKNRHFGQEESGSQDRKEPKPEETGVFLEWHNYARRMTVAMILGDASERPSRRSLVEKYLVKPGKEESKSDFILDRHLDLNFKRIRSEKENVLRQQDKTVDLNWDPWAEQCALIEGEGYNPNFKADRLEDLSVQKELGEDFIDRWQAGEFKNIRTRSELNRYIKNEYIGAMPDEVERAIEAQVRRRPNLVNYLFGSDLRKGGELYWRLVELDRFINSKRKMERVSDDYDRNLDHHSHSETSSIEDDMVNKIDQERHGGIAGRNHSRDNIMNELKNWGLTKKQAAVFVMKTKERMTVPAIASELRISERMVKKHWANIKKNTHIRIILEK